MLLEAEHALSFMPLVGTSEHAHSVFPKLYLYFINIAKYHQSDAGSVRVLATLSFSFFFFLIDERHNHAYSKFSEECILETVVKTTPLQPAC